MNDFKNGVATFVMPHWRMDNELSKVHLDEAIESVVKQTDENWHLVIIDDCSPCKEAVEYLDSIKERLGNKVTVIKMSENRGSGMVRNEGIAWAYNNHSPIVLFLDSDDVSHPRRLEIVRKHFMEEPSVNVVYSTFKIIDEFGKETPDEKIDPAILEIMDGHRNNVVEGENAWIQIATEKNYTNLTSSTAVRTDLAYETPFPDIRVSEDAHTWLRYGAHKGIFVYDETIPSLYRIPAVSTEASASRERLENFCVRKIETDTDGFFKAMEIALDNGNITEDQKDDITARFYIKLGESIKFAGESALARDLVKEAMQLNEQLATKLAEEKGLL